MDLMMMERVGDRWEKMEGSCSTGQSPQRAVVPMEEGEEEEEEEDDDDDDDDDDDGDCTETRRSCFNVNFKIAFKTIHFCISW
jgi:hypothetical protein